MKKSSHLTPGEFELMEILWPLGEATVKEVWQKVDPARNLAYTTVMTVLEKMYRKGILNQRKKGKAYIYSALLSRDDVVNGVLEHVCNTYFNGSATALSAAVNSRSAAIASDDSQPALPSQDRSPEADQSDKSDQKNNPS